MRNFVVALFISFNIISGDDRIPGLSEMAAISLSNLDPSLYYICNSDNMNQDQCLASVNNIDNIRSEMGRNATIIRQYVHSTSAVGIVIKNSRSYNVYYHWLDNNNNGVYQGKIKPFGTTATLSYITHKFYFTVNPRDTYNNRIHDIYIDGNKNMFIVPPNKNDKSYNTEQEYYLKLKKEQTWRENYERQTGFPWLSHYDVDKGPRKPTELPMYSADFVSQKYHIQSNEGYWNCLPKNKYDKSCQSNDVVNMEMEVMATHPPIFKIMNTISDVEADLIVSISKPRLYRSTVGGVGEGMTSDVRTSFNGRLAKNDHPIIKSIYKRANDIFGFNNTYDKFESLQVIHYQVGQQYTSHHDFGESGSPKQRVFTLLFYLNNQTNSDAGGETYFPKAMGKGMGLHPGKGNSVMFYSAMNDGNSNDLALHAALPVKDGEKWACNFWIWD
mmetsp:Transcript_48896/g.60110  ORF Transcript_48896/g.60110 Transcript_48896/m.60110 type:complete len:443 (-) Transcript_48896:87-1415(-)